MEMRVDSLHNTNPSTLNVGSIYTQPAETSPFAVPQKPKHDSFVWSHSPPTPSVSSSSTTTPTDETMHQMLLQLALSRMAQNNPENMAMQILAMHFASFPPTERPIFSNTVQKPLPRLASSASDREAITWGASQLGVTPEELASVIALESSFRPDIWGGDGKKYFGLIQFGPGARQEVGLDPSIHNTFVSQMPFVVKYFKQRGFNGNNYASAAERQMRLYATVLGGNPNAIHGKDSNGTSASGVLNRMLNGDLRQQAQGFLNG